MITVDAASCNACGICLAHLGGYCLNPHGAAVAIDYTVCNACQKCVAICPRQAFLVDGEAPTRVQGELPIDTEGLRELLRRRRSIKAFKDVAVPREVLEVVARAGGYAPTMNHAIEAIIVDDPHLIALVDAEALRWVRRWRTLLFGFRPVTWVVSIFARTLPIIERKMARDLDVKKRITKPGTRALILVVGDPRVPVTESSAQYYLAYMILMAQVLGLGSCLMDSLRLALAGSRTARRALGVTPHLRVLGVLAIGVPDEKVINIPVRTALRISWNRRAAPPSAGDGP